MSKSTRLSRMERLKAGQESSSESEDEAVYDEAEDAAPDAYEDDFVVEDQGYKASAHQKAAVAPKNARSSSRRGRGGATSSRMNRSSRTKAGAGGSTVISRRRRGAKPSSTAAQSAAQKGKPQKTVANFFKKTSNRNVSRNYNSNRTSKNKAAQPNAKAKSSKSGAVDDFMSDLVGDLDSDDDDDDDEPTAQIDGDVDMGAAAAQPTAAATDPEPMATEMQMEQDDVCGEPPAKRFKYIASPKKQSSTTPAPAPPTTKSDKAEMSEDEDNDVDVDLKAEVSTSSGGMFSAAKAEAAAHPRKETIDANTDSYPQTPDGMLDFFWFDAYEDAMRKPGQIYLFGKTLSSMKGTKQWISVCVLVKNIERTLFVLPRLKNKAADPEHGERMAAMDVYQEMNEKRVRLGIKKIAAIPVDKKYCFRERKNGVPSSAQYLKVCYSFDYDAMTGPRYASGKTYSHIFGAASTALELFFLDKQIMGPCWLRIPNSKPSRIVSWCKRELALSEPDLVTVLSLNYPSPNLSVLALSFQTILNDKKEHEIACISGVLNKSICVDHANATKNADVAGHQIEYFSLIRKMERNPFPYDLESALKAKHYNVTPQTLKTFSSERELLTFFATRVQSLDPDVLVGHKLFDFVLDVILSRMDSLNISVWSKLGRLRKGRIPFYRNKLVRKWLGAGRLLCDTFVSAQEFVVGEKTYTLSHLATTRLSDVASHENLNAAVVKSSWTDGAELASVITHCCNDANLVLRLMLSLEVLPLTKELTNLCGNLWARSLTSQRAERNEWLLMHEFHRDGYIVPENLSTEQKIERGIIKAKKGGAGNSRKRGKAQYAGGLVLEPERGLYDKYVLCLDFNSLYPSIIQEYNLCFTSTQHWKFEVDKRREEVTQGAEEAKDAAHNSMAAMQESIGAEMGILPRVIGVLLSRRSTIKKLLKSATVESEKKRFDTQQLALKLTANSMYGCLGFQYSRFYCQPIAQLITALGRESLMKAAEIAQSVGNLRVIYGDTDSIFIYTDSADLIEARGFAKEIKRKVNKTYKRMYLELDYVYSKLLLLRKKKYAALKVVKFDTNAQGKAQNIVTKTEIKGLDMVRRDWSLISKDVGREVLDVILAADKQIDDTISGVTDLLMRFRKRLDANQIALSRFVITKKLTKAPKDYPDPHKQPHVMVAMQMQKLGMSVSTGSFIEYIVCRQNRDGSDANSSKQAMAKRAYHLKEIEASMSQKCSESSDESDKGVLEVDRMWYLEQQILPPVGRYCDPIEGTDMGQLANALGLDSAKFKHLIRSSTSNQNGGDDDDDLEDKIMRITNPLQKYKDICEPFKIMCRHCRVQYDFGGVFDFRKLDAKSGLVCATRNCSGIVSQDSAEERARDVVAIQNALSLQLWTFIRRYYAREWVCADLGCSFRTRQLGLSGGNRCPKLGCSATMKESYKASQLFDQLRYFAFLFDRVEQMKLLAQEKKSNSALAGTFLTKHHESVCDEIHAWYKKTVLERSKYYFIDSKVIFKYLV